MEKNYSLSNYAWDNAKMQLFDKHKGSIGNRAACAAELVWNNEVKNIKLLGVAGGTALAVDTFAGSKAALNGAKKLASTATDKATKAVVDFAGKHETAGKALNAVKGAATKATTYIDDVANKINSSDLANKAKKGVEAVKNNGTVKKVATKVADAATKVKNSNFVKTLSKNKVGIIIAAGIALGTKVLIDWAHKNADIEQKYEDKAKLQG